MVKWNHHYPINREKIVPLFSEKFQITIPENLLKLNNPEFIPANESRSFITIFDIYVRLLFRRRFKRVWISQNYKPASESKTIYYLNHSSWWDGLIPLLLNQKVFHQNARAMMEDKQLKQHSFFKNIGAFSVNLENPRSAVKSLRYAVDSFDRPNSSLFIYPEGKIVPFSKDKPTFRKGLAWIAQKRPDVDVVPVGIYITSAKHDKPELYLSIGEKLVFDPASDQEDINRFFEEKLSDLLQELVENSQHTSHPFTKLV